jgi:hypothetical protein
MENFRVKPIAVQETNFRSGAVKYSTYAAETCTVTCYISIIHCSKVLHTVALWLRHLQTDRSP